MLTVSTGKSIFLPGIFQHGRNRGVGRGRPIHDSGIDVNALLFIQRTQARTKQNTI